MAEPNLSARQTIVICDDNEDILQVFSMLLKAEGYAVATAHNYAELKPLLHSLKPDLLILDIQMPEMNGFDIVDEINAMGMVLPVFLVTAFDNFMYRRYAPIAGIREYMTKPVDPTLLLEKIKSALV